MSIPLNYVARNLWARRLTTLLTAGGLALVVFVFATVLMMDEGLKRTLVTTGELDNVVVIRKGAETEIQSGISREQASVIEMHPAVALGARGERMVSKETVVLISLLRAGDGKPSNVVIRGTSDKGFALRPQVKIREGRLFRPGASEIIVGTSIAARFSNTGIGQQIKFAQRDWTVVGVFDSGGSGFDSDGWRDDHHVCLGGEPGERNRHAARVGIPPRRGAVGVSGRGAAAGLRGRRGGPRAGFADAIGVVLDDQFSDLCRSVIPLCVDGGYRCQNFTVRGDDGFCRRIFAGVSRGAVENCGCAAGGIKPAQVIICNYLILLIILRAIKVAADVQ